MKDIFLLCSLPSSWDTFCTTISNSALGGVLNFDHVVGSLLAKEIGKNSMDHGKQDIDLVEASSGEVQRAWQAREPASPCEHWRLDPETPFYNLASGYRGYRH